MTPRSTFLTAVLSCAAAACSAQPDDPQGSYHLTISLRPPDLVPVQQPIPSTINWPHTTDLTLRFDDAGHAQVQFFDQQQLVTEQVQVTASNANRFIGTVAAGTLFLAIDSTFTVIAADVVACPPPHSQDSGDYVELFFLNGHVHGATSGVVSCNLPAEGDPVEGFMFDVSGDRVSE